MTVRSESPDPFVAMAEQAFAEIPEELRLHCEGLVFRVADWPDRARPANQRFATGCHSGSGSGGSTRSPRGARRTGSVLLRRRRCDSRFGGGPVCAIGSLLGSPKCASRALGTF